MAIINNMARWDGTSRQRDASGGPRYSTNVATVQSGKTYRKANWENSLGAWDLGNRGVTETEYQTLLDFFHAMMGKAYGFRVRDWTDFRDNGRGVFGNGVCDPSIFIYQMNKQRTVADQTRLQKITRPVGFSYTETLGNTIKIYIDGNLQPQDNVPSFTIGEPDVPVYDPASWRLDDSTGLAIYTPIQFSPARFEDNGGGLMVFTTTIDHSVLVGDWIFIKDVPAPFEALNGPAQVVATTNNTISIVSAVVGSRAGQINNGISIALPKDKPLTWTGEFDFPAAFDTDSFTMNRIDHFIETDGITPESVAISLGSIPVSQVRE